MKLPIKNSQIANHIYENYPEVDNIVLISLQGSRAYGTNKKDSDYDVYVVSHMNTVNYLTISDVRKSYSEFSIENVNVQHFDLKHFLQMVNKSNYMAFSNLFTDDILYYDFRLVNLITEYKWNWKTLAYQISKACLAFRYKHNETNELKHWNLAIHRFYLLLFILRNKEIPKSHNIQWLKDNCLWPEEEAHLSSMISVCQEVQNMNFELEQNEYDLNSLFYEFVR